MRRIALATAGGVIALLVTGLCACAGPQLALDVGLSGRFLAQHFAPLRITVSGVESPAPGTFILSQRVGTAWRGEAQSRIEVPYETIGNGTYDLLLPVYDATGSLSVSLESQDGAVAASAALDLRQGRQDTPFRVVVGDHGALPAAVPAVDPTDLPSQWLAYEGLSALWLARLPAPLGRGQWEAIARWVLAGGLLVVWSGTDFYLLDTPALRDLLPVTTPTVDRHTGLLVGTPRPGARVVLESDEGDALLLSYPYGLGIVLLATMSAATASPQLVQALDAPTPTPQSALLSNASAELLEDTLLDHPDYTQAVLLVVVCLLGTSLLVAHVEHPRRRIVLLLGFAMVLAVSCGLVINRTNSYSSLYTANTELLVKRSVGVSIDSFTLFSPRAETIHTRLDIGNPLLQTLPHDLRSGRFDIALGSEGSVTLALARGERRGLRAGGASDVPVSVHLPGDEQVEITNGLPMSLHGATLLLDGRAVALGTLAPGTTSLTLEVADASEPPAPPPRALQETLTAFRGLEPLQHGTWLLAASLSEQRVRGDPRQKVRVATVLLVEVVRDAPAI